ncbi:GNAT family N-acetyltransferase [Maribacter sp. 2307ULW6-5]|uniref:GNAT family N-acetyltransferase n=1 Tax=Maribacter sp. 2307ULW6-5 TaxID=3386275 RepID=UPI0039BD1BF7
MEITRTETENKGAAIATKEGKKAGEMTYSKASASLIIIDHTEVDQAFKGQGVGKKLLYDLVDMARQKKVQIIPLCPFAKAMFNRHEELQDVLKK